MSDVSDFGEVTVVTVSYNSAAMLRGMLASVPKGVPVVVVDNASTDDTAEVAVAAGASLVKLEINQGFGRGCNAGARLAQSDFLFFLNPDARLEDGCLEELLAAARRRPDASAINPKIVNPSGRVELKWRSVLLTRSEWKSRTAGTSDMELPALAGGALWCRRACFEKVGGFDPNIFLFHEDDDLAIRMRSACGPLLFAPRAVVRHEAGRSSGRSPQMARLRGYHLARSRVYAMTKHDRAFPFARTLAAALGGLAMPQNFLSSRRRAKYLGQLRGALSALHDGGKFG